MQRIVNVPGKKITKALLRVGGIGDCVWLLPTARALDKKGHGVSVHVRREMGNIFLHNPHVAAVNLYDEFEDLTTRKWTFYIEPGAEPVQCDSYIEKLLQSDISADFNMGCKIHPALVATCGDCMSGKLSRMERVKGKNFPEMYLELAGCAGDDPSYLNEFYFSKLEHSLLKQTTADWKDKFVILWLLGHQGYHTYPRVFEVAHEFTEKHPDTVVYITGYEYLLRHVPSTDSVRIVTWPLRQLLGLLGYVNLIVGSATGIMNAAGGFDTPKICMLSTVFPEQFGKHWVNTTWIDPDVACSPCHQIHKDWKTCPSVNNWTACTANLDKELVMRCVENARTNYIQTRRNDR